MAQQASGYHVDCDMFHISQRPMSSLANRGEAEPEPTVSANNEIFNAGENQDWRKPIIDYLCDPRRRVDRAVQRMAFKYTMRDDDLYHRMVDDVLLKCLDEDQARVAMGEVHEGICGTHQSAPKMKWLLRRAGFYWLTMINDCFTYYKGCEACQNLVIFSWLLLLCYIPLSSRGLSKDGV